LISRLKSEKVSLGSFVNAAFFLKEIPTAQERCSELSVMNSQSQLLIVVFVICYRLNRILEIKNQLSVNLSKTRDIFLASIPSFIANATL
jgi:hypothetical protein